MKLALSLALVATLTAAAEPAAARTQAAQAATSAKTKAAPKKKVYPKNPTPTAANYKYGPHERNVLDFWQAKSDQPTPVLFFIHGGGWMGATRLASPLSLI